MVRAFLEGQSAYKHCLNSTHPIKTEMCQSRMLKHFCYVITVVQNLLSFIIMSAYIELSITFPKEKQMIQSTVKLSTLKLLVSVQQFWFSLFAYPTLRLRK